MISNKQRKIDINNFSITEAKNVLKLYSPLIYKSINFNTSVSYIKSEARRICREHKLSPLEMIL